jgi:hypothetical protein
MKLNGIAPEFLPLVAAVDFEMTRVYVVDCFQRKFPQISAFQLVLMILIGYHNIYMHR